MKKFSHRKVWVDKNTFWIFCTSLKKLLGKENIQHTNSKQMQKVQNKSTTKKYYFCKYYIFLFFFYGMGGGHRDVVLLGTRSIAYRVRFHPRIEPFFTGNIRFHVVTFGRSLRWLLVRSIACFYASMKYNLSW